MGNSSLTLRGDLERLGFAPTSGALERVAGEWREVEKATPGIWWKNQNTLGISDQEGQVWVIRAGERDREALSRVLLFLKEAHNVKKEKFHVPHSCEGGAKDSFIINVAPMIVSRLRHAGMRVDVREATIRGAQ